MTVGRCLLQCDSSRTHDLLGRVAVEVAGRLVGQQHFRIVDQGAGNGYPLLFATGKFCRAVRNAIGEAHRRERVARGGSPRGTRAAIKQHRQFHVLQCRARRYQVVRLETKPVVESRNRAASADRILPTWWPQTEISPEVTRSKPPIKFSKVDLPDPDLPNSATRSP